MYVYRCAPVDPVAVSLRRFVRIKKNQVDAIMMEKFLLDYFERIRPAYYRIPGKAAHALSSAFLSFRFGLYTKTIQECAAALPLIPEGNGSETLKRAVSILNSYAEALENSRVKPDPVIAFADADRAFLAIILPPDQIEDPETLNLDNALILVYSAVMIGSPDEEGEVLEEHRKYILTLLETYKRALGIP